MITYCGQIRPFVYYSKRQITSLNCTVHDILQNEIDLILPQFPKARKEKRGIMTYADLKLHSFSLCRYF